MVKFNIAPAQVLEILRHAKPGARFAQNREMGDIWQYLPETSQWQQYNTV